MPLDKHYRGRGKKVARSMKKRYGKDWKRVFYATEAKQKNRKKRTMKR